MNPSTQQYGVITLSYWGLTLSDGALRMLVLLYFYDLGYSAIGLASLFLLYEFFGLLSNLFGGWLAARSNLKLTLQAGLLLQILALALLLVDVSLLSVAYVMCSQALSGIAKDLTKMSAKSSLKLLAVGGMSGRLFGWVASLTGSKNTLKGIGFFVGSLLLNQYGFSGAILVLLILLIFTFVFALCSAL